MPLYAGIEKLEKEGDSVQWGGAAARRRSAFPACPTDARASRSCQIPRIDVPEGKLVLTTRRGKQFNSMTLRQDRPSDRRRAARGGAHERERHAAARRDRRREVVVRSDAGRDGGCCSALVPAATTTCRRFGPSAIRCWRAGTIRRPASPTTRLRSASNGRRVSSI